MFEQTFKNIDDILHKDAGCSSELDYTEQASWMLFLKYLDDLEYERSLRAELEGENYLYILKKSYRWSKWAAPKDKQGNFNHNAALTGEDLIDYVNGDLFPYLKSFKQRAQSPNTIQYKIGEIFSEIKNKIQSGYSLRDALEKIDELRFRSQKEKHQLSHLYEAKIKNMGNAGRNGGEYYTPRPLIRAMIDVVKPTIGEKIYDGAAGSAGFLCEAFDYLRQRKNLSTNDLKILQERTFYAKEKKSLAYVIAIMNMILHGIEAPNVLHTNTLAENLADIQENSRYDIVLANPPFGGKERKEVQHNFPIKTGETAFLFLQHFIKSLKAGGRAAIVIKNTFLSNTDKAAIALRKALLTDCNLHTVLDCPAKTFLGAGVKTVVLFFTKGNPTQKIWYYQLEPGRSLGKTNALNDNDLKEFVQLQKSFSDSQKSWSLKAADINRETWELSVKNPLGEKQVVWRSPEVIIKEIIALNKESEKFLLNIRELMHDLFESYLQEVFSRRGEEWKNKKLGDFLTLEYGKSLDNSLRKDKGKYPVYGANGIKARSDKFYYGKKTIIIGRKGSAGELTMTEEKFWPLDVTYFVKFDDRKYNLTFVYYLLTYLNLPSLAIGVKPGINRNNIYSMRVNVPDVSEQKRIVKILDQAFADIEKIRANFAEKLDRLNHLKKSLLHQAFTGQLTQKGSEKCIATKQIPARI